jgi:hypothetical protein
MPAIPKIMILTFSHPGINCESGYKRLHKASDQKLPKIAVFIKRKRKPLACNRLKTKTAGQKRAGGLILDSPFHHTDGNFVNMQRGGNLP